MRVSRAKRWWLTSLLLLLGLTSALEVDAQDALPATVRVEITTNKRAYAVGEQIRFRVLLVNTSLSATWISKAFWYSGGGISGFQVNVTQLSVQSPSKCTAWAGDRFASSEPRTPEQVLKEDFILLGPSQVVGFEDRYSRCAKYYRGKYRIVAEYSASDLNQERVKSVEMNRALVLNGTYRTVPTDRTASTLKFASVFSSSRSTTQTKSHQSRRLCSPPRPRRGRIRGRRSL